MLTFTRRVGTAPGTSTLVRTNGISVLGGSSLGVMQCPPEPMPIHLVPDQQRFPIDARHFPPVRWRAPLPDPWPGPLPPGYQQWLVPGIGPVVGPITTPTPGGGFGPSAVAPPASFVPAQSHPSSSFIPAQSSSNSSFIPAQSSSTVTALSPYPMPITNMSGLGFVLAQGGGWEVNRTLPGGAPYLRPFDPQYIRRGESGFYYDTQLGAIPTDAELGPAQCYTPVQSGWIYAKEGYVAPPYIPPRGWRPVTRPYGPPTAPLGQPVPPEQDNIAPMPADMAAAAAVNELTKHQRRLFYLSALSTAAIVSVASINIFRAIRQERRMTKQHQQ